MKLLLTVLLLDVRADGAGLAISTQELVSGVPTSGVILLLFTDRTVPPEFPTSAVACVLPAPLGWTELCLIDRAIEDSRDRLAGVLEGCLEVDLWD